MNTLQNLFLSNEDETLNREVKAYQEKLTSKTNEIPIWERQWLTIEEASEYSGIARRKLRELSNTSGCPFAIWMGNKIHIIAFILEIPADCVEHDHRARISNMDKVIDGRSADIHPYFSFFQRDKLLLFPG